MASVQKIRQMIQNRPGPNPSLQNKVRNAMGKPAYTQKGIGSPQVGYGAANLGNSGGTASKGPGGPATNVQLPWDSAYESAVGAANLGYANTNTGLDQKQQALEANYGFDPAYASDPMTQANLLQNAWDTANKGSTNSLAAQGQFYSGAESNALDTNRFNYLKDYDTAQKAYTGAEADIQQQRLDAQTNQAGQIANAEGSRVSNAVQDAYNQALTESSGGIGGPVNKPKPKKPKKKGK